MPKIIATATVNGKVIAVAENEFGLSDSTTKEKLNSLIRCLRKKVNEDYLMNASVSVKEYKAP